MLGLVGAFLASIRGNSHVHTNLARTTDHTEKTLDLSYCSLSTVVEVAPRFLGARTRRR